MSGTCVNDLVNERSWEVVLGTCQIQIAKICTDWLVPCFLFTGIGLETQMVYLVGYINPDVRSF